MTAEWTGHSPLPPSRRTGRDFSGKFSSVGNSCLIVQPLFEMYFLSLEGAQHPSRRFVFPKERGEKVGRSGVEKQLRVACELFAGIPDEDLVVVLKSVNHSPAARSGRVFHEPRVP